MGASVYGICTLNIGRVVFFVHGLWVMDFYRSLGAVSLDEWTVFRLTGDELRKFGKGC